VSEALQDRYVDYLNSVVNYVSNGVKIVLEYDLSIDFPPDDASDNASYTE
jgi:hypothetical protein